MDVVAGTARQAAGQARRQVDWTARGGRPAVSAEALTLFGAGPDEPPEKLSDDRRRTVRQLEALRHGQHPIGLAAQVVLRLHPDAAPADDRDAPGHRCGTCRFRALWGAHSFPKCLRGEGKPFARHSAASDCRAWWPACEHYAQKISGSDKIERLWPLLTRTPVASQVMNQLKRHGYQTVGQVASLTASEVLEIRNIGPDGLAELKRALGAAGYQLASEAVTSDA